MSYTNENISFLSLPYNEGYYVIRKDGYCIIADCFGRVTSLHKQVTGDNRDESKKCNATADKKDASSTGATRNSIGPYAFEELNPEFLREMAKVMYEGQQSHGKGNYRNGMPLDSIYKHMMNHMMQWKEGDTSENHLAKVACNAMILAWMQEHKPNIKD